MNYTKGEWKVVDHQWQDKAGGDILFVETAGEVVAELYNEDDARLIAQAPKLYEALKAVLDQKDDPQLYTALSGQDWIDIENAIAKVEEKC